MKQKTIQKYSDIFNAVKKSGKSLKAYCENNGLNYNSIYQIICSLKRQNNKESTDINNLLNLYNSIPKSSAEVDNNDVSEAYYERDSEGKITGYKVISYKVNQIPFETILSRSEMETICGLYTYYGGNVTARIVSNEFPKYTLAEVKRILRAFNITKDSFWTPPHLLEELSLEELSQYRLNLKERAAFKYADAKLERDYNNLIKKLTRENLDLKEKLNDRKTFLENLEPTTECYISKETNNGDKVLIITLSDLHVGAYNTPYGFVDLPEYNEEEIKRRLKKIIDFAVKGDYDQIIVLNLGDSVDSYKKETSRGGHLLPGSISDKDMSKMYINIMVWFFNSLNKHYINISYACIGESNHDSDWGWLNNIALANILQNTLNIECAISDYPIDVVNIDNTSIIMTHGKNNYTQTRAFPLTLNERTINWFNDWFLTCNQPLKDNKIVVKGDLHQFAITECKSFKYVSMPSLYGSSQYIVSNFGKTKWGCGYIEYQNGELKYGTISE